MADRDGAFPVEGNDSSSHSEARSYLFDTIGQVLIQLAYNLQERRYGGGRGDHGRGEGGSEDMFPLNEQLRDSESSLPSYTPLSPPRQIGQLRQVCQIGDKRHQPGGSRTPPAIQGVRREDRYEPLSEQTVEERRHDRRQEERQERHPPRHGEYRRDDARRGDDETWDERLMLPLWRTTEIMAATMDEITTSTSTGTGTKGGSMNQSIVMRRSVDAPELIMTGNDDFILGREKGRIRGYSSEGRHSLCPPSWKIQTDGGRSTRESQHSQHPPPGITTLR